MQNLKLDFNESKFNPNSIEQHFVDLIEMYPLAFVFTDFNGRIIKCNTNFKNLFHENDIKEQNQNIFNYFVFEENKIEILEKISDTNNGLEFEVEMMKEDGNFFLAAVISKKTIINDEKYIYFVIYDIGEEKEKTEERERLLEELALSRAQIEEEAARYVQINNQLAESEAKLKEANATKDKFFSIIGHDLKNPLFVIQSMSEILETEFDEISSEERLEFIQAIRESSKNAYALLEDLLHWARCQSGRIDYNPEPIHLKQLVSKCINLLEAHAIKKEINLINAVDPTHILMADKFMIDTILRNLISNALKFTPEGGTVKVQSKIENEFIEISVEDTGIGLTENDRQKLFRIDVKNSEIGRSKEKGTGLGLILCKEFVEKHSGKIWVESEFEKGSKFKFTIPKLH
ncbi:MAG: PAS domain-containing sensor histidine kinase [Melioribacteraceae bacterium]|nr:PAS domain-containing sensor histidine kinase [Melioribacteraceae bacterium]